MIRGPIVVKEHARGFSIKPEYASNPMYCFSTVEEMFVYLRKWAREKEPKKQKSKEVKK